MYERPVGISLCHAWGANPIYLIFRCILGVEPYETGYAQFICRPNLIHMPDFKCVCPVGKGKLHVEYDVQHFTVKAEDAEGFVASPSGFAIEGADKEQELYKMNAGETLVFVRR